MVTILLEQIIELLKGFIDSFKDHAAEVAEKLGLISEDTSDINDTTEVIASLDSAIKDNTDILVANTGAIKNSSQATSTNTAAIASDTTVIRNNINTISVNSGKTAAFTEDVATNTLNILDKITTIASDTTQMRSDNQVIIANTNDLETYVKLLGKGLKKTSYIEGDLVEFNTDLRDSLVRNNLTIPVDANGITDIEYTLCGKNLLDPTNFYEGFANYTVDGNASIFPAYKYFATFHPIPADRDLIISYRSTDSTLLNLKNIYVVRTKYDKVVWFSGMQNFAYDEVKTIFIEGEPDTDILICITSDSSVVPIPTPIQGLIQVEFGDTATTYEPFTGHHYKEELGETLTQGGVLDLITGVLTRNDNTTKQLTPIDIKTNEGNNFIFNTSIRVWHNPNSDSYNIRGDINEIGYNETIYNVIEREV